jgi:hypothetical protein
MTIELYEGSTAIVGGTPVIPRNNERESITVSGMTVLRDPTSITAGFRADGFLAGAGRTAGFAERGRENVLARNTSYLFRMTGLSNSNNVSWCFDWYEHTSSN